MPSDITTPATLTYGDGAFRDTRVTPARLRFNTSSIITTFDTPATTAAEIPELDRLTSLERILNDDGTPSLRLMAIWQDTMEAIESAFEAVNARVDEVAILARLSNVEALAQVANDNAATAAATATAVATATEETFADIDPIYRDGFSERFILF